MEKQENDHILNAIIIASAIGILVVAGLILFYPQPSENFTELYFGNYTKTPVDGMVYFTATIVNHENDDVDYLVSYLVDGTIVSGETVFVPDKGNVTLEKSLAVNSSKISKIQVTTDSSEDIHFFTTT